MPSYIGKHWRPEAALSVRETKVKEACVFFTDEAHTEKSSPRKWGWSCSLFTKPLTEILWSFRKANLYHSWMNLSSMERTINILNQFQTLSGTFKNFDNAYTENKNDSRPYNPFTSYPEHGIAIPIDILSLAQIVVQPHGLKSPSVPNIQAKHSVMDQAEHLLCSCQ